MNTANNAIYKIKQECLHPHRPTDKALEASRYTAESLDENANQRADDALRAARNTLAPAISASGKAILRKHKELVQQTSRLYHRVQRDLNVQSSTSTSKSNTKSSGVATTSAPSMANTPATFDDNLRYVPGWSKQTTLSDGTGVTLRLLLPEDREGLKAGFERLSAQSRYQRFMSPMDVLPERYLEYLTEIDYRTHFAVVAGVEDPVRFELDGLGIARFIALEDIENEAELAITVSDEAQGRGLGIILMDILLRAAQERGLVALRAEVLPDNAGMQKLAEKFHGTREAAQDGLVTWRVPVPPAEEDAQST